MMAQMCSDNITLLADRIPNFHQTSPWKRGLSMSFISALYRNIRKNGAKRPHHPTQKNVWSLAFNCRDHWFWSSRIPSIKIGVWDEVAWTCYSELSNVGIPSHQRVSCHMKPNITGDHLDRGKNCHQGTDWIRFRKAVNWEKMTALCGLPCGSFFLGRWQSMGFGLPSWNAVHKESIQLWKPTNTSPGEHPTFHEVFIGYRLVWTMASQHKPSVMLQEEVLNNSSKRSELKVDAIHLAKL